MGNTVSGQDNILKVDMGDIIRDNYIKYAKSVITDRAFPFIDGLKPVNRRILYSAYKLKIPKGQFKKSAKIVGDTMGNFHPHGDASIYGAMVNMTDTRESLNAPLIKGKGSFGKSWSVEHYVPSAQRYTEATLSDLAKNEMFDGITENAVDMILNYSMDQEEPRLLPVKFPSIIVNNTNGVAVGMSTYIPTYTLRNACLAVKALIENPEITDEELSEVLGAPDFVTGGNLHITDSQRLKLIRDGYAKSVYMTGNYSISKNTITIYELPYNTNIERVISDIKELYKSGVIKGVKSIDNTSGRSTVAKKDSSKCRLKIEIGLTKNADPEYIMKAIRQNTTFSNPISFNTKFVWWNDERQDFEYKECGVRDLLVKYWIPFRMNCIRRQYTYRYDEAVKRAHELSAWKILMSHLDEYIAFARSHKRAETREYLINVLGLDDVQADYIFQRRLVSLTVDEAQKMLDEVVVAQKEADELHAIITNDSKILAMIADDMKRIAEKYGTDRKSSVTSMDIITSDKEERKAPEVIPQYMCYVGYTDTGAVKKAIRKEDTQMFDQWSGTKGVKVLQCNNTDTLLVFTSHGYCYKVPVSYIEMTRGYFRDSIWKFVDRAEDDVDSEIINVVATNDYKGTFTILYSSGFGVIVPYASVSGNRKRYKSIYPEFENGKSGMIYNSDRFYVVTMKDCAAYVNLTDLKETAELVGKRNFKLPRWNADDTLRGFVSEDSISLSSYIERERFERPYCVKMRGDKYYITNQITKENLANSNDGTEKEIEQ